jgi:hypothetical protein
VAVVNPGDTHCLARAIVLGLQDRRHRHLRLPNAQFRVWAEGQRGEAGAASALELMTLVGLQRGLPLYGVADAQRVQRWLDTRLGPQQVRLVLLDRDQGFRVAWKGAQPAHFTLTLVCANHHWSYVQQPQQIFRVSHHTYIYSILSPSPYFIQFYLPLYQCANWCPDCERRVERRTHPTGCPACCHACYRFGIGYPCKREAGTPAQRCDQCHLLFVNGDCFAAHRRHVDAPTPGWEHDRRRCRPHRSLCEERHCCPRCGAIFWPQRQGAHQCQVQSGAAAPTMGNVFFCVFFFIY